MEYLLFLYIHIFRLFYVLQNTYLVIVYHRCFPLSDVSNQVGCQHVHKFSMCWVRHFVERLWGTMIDQCCVCWCHVRKQMNCIGDKVQPKGVFRGALVTHMWHAVEKLINNHCNQISDMPPDSPRHPPNPPLQCLLVVIPGCALHTFNCFTSSSHALFLEYLYLTPT